MAAPWGAKPKDQLSLKYQPVPLASCGVLPVPVSKKTSARGAWASRLKLAWPTGRQAYMMFSSEQAARMEAIEVPDSLYSEEWQTVQPPASTVASATFSCGPTGR